MWGGAYHNLFIPQLTLIKNCVISSVNSIGKAVIWCWELGADTAVANSHVCLLVVDISLHLSVDRHVSRVCMGCFYRLRQLWRIRRSLDFDSLAMLIYAVVNSRMDYCNTVLAGAPRTVMDKLQRVLNAAVRAVTSTWEFDHGLGQILHDQQHWLDVPDRVLPACCDSSPVSERPCTTTTTTVSVGALHLDLRR